MKKVFTSAEIKSFIKHSLIPALYPLAESGKQIVPIHARPTVPADSPLYVRKTNRSGVLSEFAIKSVLNKLEILMKTLFCWL